ncbi:unnamed protein product [Prorocentrum cordatum]|uniref:SMB domain-containing protein n=1 Tax=Prorocentrum cordatum TaxID=2364126 RepID=A0ABN9S946_9DINO|nr:unnamed protein product [Polarella glacialis]
MGGSTARKEQHALRRRARALSAGLLFEGRGAVLVAALVSVLAAATAITAASVARGRQLRRMAAAGLELQLNAATGGATWVPEFESSCGVTEVDVEYVDEVSGWGTNYDHIPTPEMCCAMCQGEPRCKAFTWVKDAGLPDGCRSQCWLKGGTGTPREKKGLVSGRPPPRRSLDKIPAGAGGKGGSLFCMSLMVPGTDEEKLLLWQYTNKASIFACDATAIYSNQEIELAKGVTTLVIDSDLKCEYGGDSQSALNSWIFIALWQKLIDDGEYANHDWVVKADPDAVFFPDRLGAMLAEHKGHGYINNCRYGMHGPIEVLSKRAVDALAKDYAASFDGKAPKRCVEEQDFGQWGEDMFLDQCLGTVLEVAPHPVDVRLMCESHCDCPAWYWCQNGTDRVSYHPFKTVAAYQNCMANALGGPELDDGVAQPTPAPGPKPKVLAGRTTTSGSGSSRAALASTTGRAEMSGSSSSRSAPASTTPGKAPRDRFDCDAGISRRAGWSGAKKDWCCANKQKGCDEDDAGDADAVPADEQTCKDYGCVDSFDPERSCQCNPDCASHGSCCEDYQEACGDRNQEEPDEDPQSQAGALKLKAKAETLDAEESCANYGCGGEYDEDQACQCTADCADYHNCCPDMEDECKGVLGTAAAASTTDAGGASTTAAPATTTVATHAGQDAVSTSSAPLKDEGAAATASADADKGEDEDEDAGADANADPQQPAPGPRAQTFYMYRAQSEATYPLENINTADLAGVLWYLHNEVIVARPRKYKIDRIKRYKVTVKNTWEFWNAHKRQFSAFVAYDAARCSTPVCKDIYNQYGFIVGCQTQDLNVAAYLAPNQTSWNCEKGSDECRPPVWYSLPGPCPAQGMDNGRIDPNKVGLDVSAFKSKECIKKMPGGRCDKASGAPDCTYSYEEAGEIMLDELAGIDDYDNFWNYSYVNCLRDKSQHKLSEDEPCIQNKEYDVKLDKGVGTKFWDGKLDKKKCEARMESARQLFKKHFPEFPADYDEPACEFDMYYENEFTWGINHTGAEPSSWWDNKMAVSEFDAPAAPK